MDKKLGLGKVTRDIFERCVLPYIPLNQDLELDGATVKFNNRIVIAHSPSIGVPLESLGFFAFHYAACNVAVRFGQPKYLSTGIYLPLNATEDDLVTIAKSLGNEAKKYNVKVIAGQTATYFGLDIPFISTTCFGEAVRDVIRPSKGDIVFLVGDVGGEAVWLSQIGKGSNDEIWKNFTSYPIVMTLQKLPGVNMMHDISEGGIKGSLIELLYDLKLGLGFNSKIIHYAKNAELLDQDILRAPSYGTLIVIISPAAADDFKKICESFKKKYVSLGPLVEKRGLVVDNESVESQNRIPLDELYRGFKKG